MRPKRDDISETGAEQKITLNFKKTRRKEAKEHDATFAMEERQISRPRKHDDGQWHNLLTSTRGEIGAASEAPGM